MKREGGKYKEGQVSGSIAEGKSKSFYVRAKMKGGSADIELEQDGPEPDSYKVKYFA